MSQVDEHATHAPADLIAQRFGIPTNQGAPAAHVHGPDCNHDHDDHHHHAQPGHVHGPDCNHDHHHAPIRKIARPGRNEPCHCGSGRKYKKCCLAIDGD